MTQIISTLKGLGGGLIALFILYGGIWIKRVFDQKKRNTVNEIDLSFKKIDLDNKSKPLDDLVSDSNKSHGVGSDDVVKKPGDDSKSG